MADETKTWTISTLQDITFSRGCQICGEPFEISSLNDPRILCQNCVTTLRNIIKQKKDEQVTVENQMEEHIIKTSTDLISRQALCRYALNQKNKSVTPNDIMRFPSAEQEQQNARIFQGIIVEYPSISTYPEYKGKPYFSIEYIEDEQDHIGYGTYKPDILSEYLKEYFMPSADRSTGKWIKTKYGYTWKENNVCLNFVDYYDAKEEDE